MPTVQVSAELSPDMLLKAAEQLSEAELERFATQVVALRGRRRVPSLPRQEAELLLRINQAIPADLHARFQSLIAKRQAETLPPNEHAELLDLTEKIEQRDAERMKHLAELARLRQTTLTGLIEQLGIRPASYLNDEGHHSRGFPEFPFPNPQFPKTI